MRLIFLTLLLIAQAAHAGVQSETIFFVQPDGESYLLERSIHSDSPTHRFHLDKGIRLSDIRHISPARFEWDDQSDEQLNSLSFDAGGFTLIYPGQFGKSELTRDKEGNFHYTSWDGKRSSNGLYGYWYSPGQFDQFTYTWIVPNNIELLRYRANQQGKWTRRSNSISFYAEQVNNLTFEMSYRVTPVTPGDRALPTDLLDMQPVATPLPLPSAECPPCGPEPEPRELVEPISTASENADTDGDGINEVQDLCPDTAPGAVVDKVGCPLDTDKDGVPDGVDQCIATPEEIRVDIKGCAEPASDSRAISQ